MRKCPSSGTFSYGTIYRRDLRHRGSQFLFWGNRLTSIFPQLPLLHLLVVREVVVLEVVGEGGGVGVLGWDLPVQTSFF